MKRPSSFVRPIRITSEITHRLKANASLRGTGETKFTADANDSDATRQMRHALEKRSRMNISEICIRRPVFTWVLVAIPVVLGIVSYYSLGVDLFPKVDLSAVSISAHLAGASAEEIETTVTKLIEEAVNQVSGIDELRSTTREGVVTVAVQFRLDKDGDVAAQEVRDKVSSILNQLPQGMEPPIINRFDLDASPIITIGVAGRRDVREVTEIAKHQIQEQLQTVAGVGAVFVSGGRNRAINVVIVEYRKNWPHSNCRWKTCYCADHSESGSPRRHRESGFTGTCPANSRPHADGRSV